MSLESLKERFQHTSSRKESYLEMGFEWAEEQIKATYRLADALNKRIKENGIERDSGVNEPGWKSYDAFFKSLEPGVVFRVSSTGLPDEIDGYGMFLYVYAKEEDVYAREEEETIELLGLQTAKSSEAVGWDQVLWLSCFSPEQLDFMADFVGRGVPISKDEFFEMGGLW